jgi:cytochrome c oxidase accessory protein FixG
MWLGLAFYTGFTFVAYFTDADDLIISFFTLSTNISALIWIALFTVATYVNAGWLREQVCLYMCPYARFQAAMFDSNTLIVSYDTNRGEPRGSRKKNVDPSSAGLGDCVDCELCVQVCPTGIDIRNGLQYECIGCALCIDACNSIMDKMEYPRGLIRYTSENELRNQAPAKHLLLRPATLGYFFAIIFMVSLFSWKIISRIPLSLDIIRDRGHLYEEKGNAIENNYTAKIINMTEEKQFLTLGIINNEYSELVGKTNRNSAW